MPDSLDPTYTAFLEGQVRALRDALSPFALYGEVGFSVSTPDEFVVLSYHEEDDCVELDFAPFREAMEVFAATDPEKHP